MTFDPPIAPSARKHGIDDADILHAYRCAIIGHDQDDGILMIVGPGRSGQLLEIGVIPSTSGRTIIHAMTARERFLR